MSPRTLTLIPIVVVAVFLGLLVLIVTGGGDDDGGSGSAATAEIADPLAEALTFVPTDAPLVGVVETDTAAGPAAALQALGGRIPGAALASGALGELLGDQELQAELLPLLGNPLVVTATELPREDATPAPAGLPFRVPSPRRLAEHVRVATVVRDRAGLDAMLDRMTGTGMLQRDGESRGFDRYTRTDGASLAVDGPVLVATGSRTDLGQALTLHARATRGGGATGGDGTGALTPVGLRERLAGLPGRGAAVARIAADVEELQDADLSELEVPWLGALRRVALALVPSEDGLDVRFRLATDPESVTDGDVPIATGPGTASPAAQEDAPVVVGIRNVAHTIEFVRRTLRSTAPELAAQVDGVESSLRRLARVDPSSQLLLKLTGTTTVTLGPGGGVEVRAEVRDPEMIEDVLRRLPSAAAGGALTGGVSGEVDLAGIALRDQGDGTYVVERDGGPLARVAVLGEALVVSTDDSTDLQALADAFPESPPEGARGALTARVSAEEAIDLVGLSPDLAEALGTFGTVTLQARGETEAVSGSIGLVEGDE
ncbi:hypothetical protein GKE82_17760 [Conexibacter sp. W3-3-2]|uniref:hypothetical protein n=1 Tax=Conexibacter sp. W3-3-2 TaxID=2675227 RepID=UPI0012B8A238|nr:hypothetical protein [Conexibacter sp. W3-3-2]MTD46080.1 hypothetical protein [Conexibacter sp. W3-3-2]